jgi:hypothetical protein
MRKQSDFRADRDWNLDLPDIDDVKTLEQQHAYQRALRAKWEAMPELPSSIMELPFPDVGAPWWQDPYAPSPEQQRANVEKQMKRIMRNGRQ